MILTITKNDIERALAPSPWDLGNEVLYTLCRENPKHKLDEAIIAKIWLIGRTYAAAIERRKNAKEGSDSFYERIVTKSVKNSKIDEWLADLPGKIVNPWEELGSAITVHKRLMDLFATLTGLEKRALASKYLHFHRPDVFFIYDSRAKTALSKLTPNISHIPNIKRKESDKEYLLLVRRCLWLKENIEKRHSVVLTPRQIDKILLGVANRIGESGRQQICQRAL